ncbi:hypothetical protein L1887_58119 [Cichorium endivia]|nr:hypothetical protein L1887_58119 [Cichorium endivia]
MLRVPNERLEIRLADSTDRIDIRRATVVLGQLLGPRARFRRRVLGAHVAGDKHAVAQLLRRGRHPRRILLLVADPANVRQHLRARVGRQHRSARSRFSTTRIRKRGEDEPAHAEYNRGGGARVDAARERNKVALGARAAQIVPEPARRSERDLLLGRVVAHLDRLAQRRKVAAIQACRIRRCTASILSVVRGGVGRGGAGSLGSKLLGLAQVEIDIDARASFADRLAHRLHATALGATVRAHIVQIHRRRDDLHIVERELRALRDDDAVDRDERAAIVVEPVAVAALLVGVQIDAAQLERRLLDELDAPIQLAQLVVRRRRVGKDLDATQALSDVRRVRGEELLAQLDAQHRVPGLDHRVAKRHRMLASDVGDDARQCEIVRVVGACPGRKVAHLAVVAVVGEPHLGSDVEDLGVEQEEATVVECRAVEDGHADVAQDAVRRIGGEDLAEHLPRMQHGVRLEKVVEAAIAGDLELGPDAQTRACSLGQTDRLEDALAVAVKVERPLVERARRDGAAKCTKGQSSRCVLREPGTDPEATVAARLDLSHLSGCCSLACPARLLIRLLLTTISSDPDPIEAHRPRATIFQSIENPYALQEALTKLEAGLDEVISLFQAEKNTLAREGGFTKGKQGIELFESWKQELERIKAGQE